MDDSFNDTLPVLSEEEDFVDDTINNQSDDSVFRGSSTSSLYIPVISKGLKCSTPKRNKIQGGRSDSASCSALSAQKCHICHRQLKTQKGLDRHITNHKLEERARRKPTPDQLIDSCILSGSEIARYLQEAPSSQDITGKCFSAFARSIGESAYPEPSAPFRQFVKVCVEPLANALFTSKSLLPSAIRKEVRSTLHSSLADSNIRSARLEALVCIAGGPLNIAEHYLVDFCRKLVHSTVAFVIKEMREAVDDQHVLCSQKFSKDDFDSLFSQQTLHNVAGYSVKAVLRRCRQYPRSPRWREIQRVVLDRFAHIGTMEARPGEKNFWTAVLARKSYTFVSGAALEFFVEVAKVICYTETSVGSLSKDSVLQNVSSSPSIIAKWGNLTESTLREVDSMFLMRLLVLSLCNTFGRGILLRRTNKEAEEHRGRVSAVGLRARLTR